MLSLLLLPWVSVLIICVFASWYSLNVLGLDALLAPVLKVWLLIKPLLFKTLPALLVWIWIHTGAKVVGWFGEAAVFIGTLLGGWKAWSVKKLARHGARFFISLSAKFVALSVLISLLFSRERRGVKSLPKLAMHTLRKTWFGRVLKWWGESSERKKRLVLGLLLCFVLVLAGQAMLGISVLLFDLVWELLLLLWRMLRVLWRFISPTILRLVPNFIGNFVTRKLVPLFADVIPIVKDDHRVMYLRFNIRRHLRRIKAWLYLNSRARRGVVRYRIATIVGENVRSRKEELLDAAVKLDVDEVEAKKDSDDSRNKLPK